jgi:hypothetical protein
MEGVWAERLAALIAPTLALDPSLRPSAAQLLPPPNPDVPHVGGRVVARPELLDRLKRAVLAPAARAVAVTSQAMNKRKVWGMGGVGKTTLTKVLMSEEDVRTRFRDGVAWVVLGNEGPSLTARQEMIHEQLLGKSGGLPTSPSRMRTKASSRFGMRWRAKPAWWWWTTCGRKPTPRRSTAWAPRGCC